MFHYVHIICGLKIVDTSGGEGIGYQSKLRLGYTDQTDELYSDKHSPDGAPFLLQGV